jgi:molybdopterin synthase sulfur carrier subunit
MIKVEFLGPINREPLEMEASSLQDVADRLQKLEGLEQWLDKCAVAINGEMSLNLNQTLNSGDTVSILPPVCGG